MSTISFTTIYIYGYSSCIIFLFLHFLIFTTWWWLLCLAETCSCLVFAIMKVVYRRVMFLLLPRTYRHLHVEITRTSGRSLRTFQNETFLGNRGTFDKKLLPIFSSKQLICLCWNTDGHRQRSLSPVHGVPSCRPTTMPPPPHTHNDLSGW